MEEEVEVAEDYFSEDEHSPTDASEDSVEVRVSSISGRRKGAPSPHSCSLPHKLRKNYHAPSASTFADPTTGRASPSARASRRKAAEPRRLLADELRSAVKRSSPLDDPDDLRPSKSQRLDNDYGGIPEYSNSSPPSPGQIPHLPLGQQAFLGSLVRPGLPQLLLPHPWPPVATAQYPYGRLVGSMMAPPLGLIPPGLPHAPYPLLPLMTPHHPAAGSRPLLLRPPISPPMTSPLEERIREDQPLSLVSRREEPSPRESQAPPRTSSHLSAAQLSVAQISHINTAQLTRLNDSHVTNSHPHTKEPHKNSSHPPSVEVSVVQKVGRPPSKFLSVESLLGNDIQNQESKNHNSTTVSSTKAFRQEVPDMSRASSSCEAPIDGDSIQSLLHQPKQKQRNYKNMTRERRIEANARERTRVHTISAAFEKLRTAVPAYSHNQKLSKLSVLRIACSYILSLSRLAGQDYSEDGSEPSFSDCVDLTTRTIQIEGKAKKKRDE